MKHRVDQYSECAPPGAPHDVFKQSFCDRCFSAECLRSQVGKSKFEARIGDWEEKLFKHPPIMLPSNPLFAAIAGKRFTTIDPDRMPEIRSDWLDPRDLKEPEPFGASPVQLMTPEEALAARPGFKKLPTPEPVAQEVVPEAPPATPPNPKPSPRSTLGLMGHNAPDQSGRVLPGPSERPTTKADPWAPPVPPDPADVIIQPGARIKMGGSGV